MSAIRLATAVTFLAAATHLGAQVVPTTPSGFATRSTGATSSSGISISTPQQQAQTTVKHISFVALGTPRQWTSNDGKPLLAKLIAWEQSEHISVKGQPAPPPSLPPMPNGPTVIRDDKVRLLVGDKPFELSLTRLSESDQEFIAEVVASFAQSRQQMTANEGSTDQE